MTNHCFLVVGCGSIGKRHIRNLQNLDAGELLAYDIRDDRRHEVASLFDIDTVDSIDDIWQKESLVVLITLPTSMHVGLAVTAAQHGCPLFIEKPLSDKKDGTEILLDIVDKKNLITLVGCNMRFHPGLRKIKNLIEQKAIGNIVAARVEFGQYLPDWHPWEDHRKGYSANKDLGGGIILDAIHELDYIRWMMGDIEAVSCFAGNLGQLGIETEDTAAIILRFANGAIGQIHLDYIQRSYSRSCQLIGTEGTIKWDDSADEVRWYCAGSDQWQVYTNPEGWDYNQMYIDEMRHFLNCLNGKEKPEMDVFEAVKVLETALAAKNSANSGTVIVLQR